MRSTFDRHRHYRTLWASSVPRPRNTCSTVGLTLQTAIGGKSCDYGGRLIAATGSPTITAGRNAPQSSNSGRAPTRSGRGPHPALRRCCSCARVVVTSAGTGPRAATPPKPSPALRADAILDRNAALLRQHMRRIVRCDTTRATIWVEVAKSPASSLNPVSCPESDSRIARQFAASFCLVAGSLLQMRR